MKKNEVVGIIVGALMFTIMFLFFTFLVLNNLGFFEFINNNYK